MDIFISEGSFIAFANNIAFYLSALLSFACSASLMLFGVVYRNDSFWKSTAMIITGIAVLVGIAWGLETLGWAAPREISLAAALVVGPSWIVITVGIVSLVVIECSRGDKNKFGGRK